MASTASASPCSRTTVLQHFDGTPAAYLRVAREIEHDEASRQGLRTLRTAIVSTCTLDLLSPYIVVEGFKRGLAIQPMFAPYGQLEQQVLDAESATYRCNPDVIMLAVRAEEATPHLTHGFLALEPGSIDDEVTALVERIVSLIRAIRERSHAFVIVWNQVLPRRLAAGLADISLDLPQADAMEMVNGRLAETCRQLPGVQLFDVRRVANEVGLNAWEDVKLSFLARAPLATGAHVAVAKRLARMLRALVVPPCKCLVLDLDNTLWGGVLGEDGVGGIAIGEEYPGNVFADFQRYVRSLRDRGILLALASKNNEADVVELFDRRPDLVLHLDDFAARQIHWNEKAGSLATIARELNIGTEALAFFDDSPVEREWVRARMPEVHVIDVPPDPLRYAAAIESSGVFDSLALTAEDRTRAHQYRGEQPHRVLAESASSLENFLQTLDMRVQIGSVDAMTLPRVVQLIAKTNQFNLTTRRHSQRDIERMMANGAIALWMRIEDRFGDNGLVGVALAVQESPDTFMLDTFLLSCRVLGRRVETALLAALVSRARARGATSLHAAFVPTKKNAPAEKFLPDHGFRPVSDAGQWRLDLRHADLAVGQVYQVTDNA